ncbi:MAG: 23S rRNA (guanosine(2251)-2'-O)-methyltransferase RlmB, partial [Vicinamibacteria bacterium]|nr:23S rRNA (guanosine(2251)-2'-O)-methyltransferase RlmB [Vicinamibacteria bacterium]
MNLICGINPVLEALAAGTRHFDRLLVVKGIRNRRVNDALTQAGQRGIPLRFESRETLDRVAAGVNHQGLIAVVSAKPLLHLEDVATAAKGHGLLVALDGVEDPRNLGAILRTAEGAGADGVLLPERRSAGLSEVVARASAGALEHVKVARVGNLSQSLGELKQRGYWVVGFDAAGTERWDAVDYKRPIVLVLGGEGRGIRRLVRENCDHVVSLPLFGHVGSLNVSVVAGIALYEVLRQRGAAPSHVRPIPLKSLAAPKHVVGPAADDAEHDPGASLSGPRAVPVPDDDGSDDSQPGYLMHEEPAWVGGHGGGGPTIEHAPRLRRDKKRRRNEDRGGRPDKRGGRPERGPRGAERSDRGDAARRRPEGEAAPAAEPTAAAEPRPAGSGAAAGAAPGGPGGDEARRRKRRRRGRRGPG